MLLPKTRRVKLSPEEYAAQRKRLAEKADYRCANCGRILPLQRDHVTKRSRGGGDEDSNAQMLCATCHDQKDNVAPSKTTYRPVESCDMSLKRSIISKDSSAFDGAADPGVSQAKPGTAVPGGSVPTALDLSAWLSETFAQGDTSKYSKTDLEIWAMRLFEKYNFHAGSSKRERRHSFEEIWDTSGGDTTAIAYGFNQALHSCIYSCAFVRGCIRNFLAAGGPPKPTILHVAEPVVRAPRPIVAPKPPEPKKRRAKKVQVETPTEKVSW